MAIGDVGAHELIKETFASTLGRKVVRHGPAGFVEGSLAKMADGFTFAVLDENPYCDGLVRLWLADGSLANGVGNQDDGSKTQSSAEPTDALDRTSAPESEWIEVDTLTKATAAETDANRAAFKGFDLFPGNVSPFGQSNRATGRADRGLVLQGAEGAAEAEGEGHHWHYLLRLWMSALCVRVVCECDTIIINLFSFAHSELRTGTALH